MDNHTDSLDSMSQRNGNSNAAKGRRYSIAERRAVIEHVESVNLERGRGGIAGASKRFGISPLTISNWLRRDGMPARGAGSRLSTEVFRRMAELHEQISQVEAELLELEKEYARLKSEI